MFVQFYLWSDSIPYTVVDSIWLDAFETQLSCEWWKIQFFIWRHEPSLHRTRATWMMMIFSLKSWRSSLFASVEKNRQHSIGNSYCSSSFYGCHIFFVGPNLWSFFRFSRGHILKMKAPSSEISQNTMEKSTILATKRFSDDLWLQIHWTCELSQNHSE